MFEGKLVRLRAHTREDLPRYVTWINDQEVARYLTFYRPIALEDEERWFAGLGERRNEEVFAIETLDGEHIGAGGLHGIDRIARAATLGIFIGNRDYWGRGYGSDAVALLLEFAFDQLNLHRVSLHVYDYNTRAIRAYERRGFVHEGRLRQAGFREGRYYDILVMGILDEEYRRARPGAAAGL